ncbi:MAG: alpha-glucosidase [Clostridia bacterium]|nr:alpha-glucosidase [Clostridia bacterium]
MQFNHLFRVTDHNETTYHFASENNHARIDFLKNMVRIALYRDGERIFPTFSVCPDDRMPESGRDKLSVDGFETEAPKADMEEGAVRFTVGSREIRVLLKNLEISYSENGKLLFKDRGYLAYNFGHEYGKGSCHFITREKEEQIFGLGDKTGDVNKNGRSFRLSVSDAMGFDARSSDPLYKHVPFYICRNSVGAYGLFYDTYSEGSFDFGREINNYYAPYKSFRCEEETLVYYVIFGDVKQILRTFVALHGHDCLPPLWTVRYCGSTMAYTDADDADRQLRGFVKRCDQYGFRAGGFYLSSGYTQIGTKRYVFHWNTDKIPSPEKLAEDFREHGIEFIPNIKPCFLTDHPLYETIARNGWFLKNAAGEPAVFPFWGGMGSYLDFTNPKAADFWTDCVKENLVDKGYESIWNDNNEYDVLDEEVYADGFGSPIRARLIRPLFSYLMTRASQKAQPGNGRDVSVSRCGIVGTSRIASTWTGDNTTDFEDFLYQHKMAMTMSLSGIYNFGQDIGGFAGPKPGKELFLRWIQYGIFTPRFVLHSWNEDGSSNMPWLYEDEIPTVKKLFDLREQLVYYLYNQIRRSTEDLLPVIYPVFLNVPDYDPESCMFFCGNDILACPVYEPGKDIVEAELPANNGNWYYNEQMISGKAVCRCGIHDLPVFFVKGGSVVRFGDEYRVYPQKEGAFKETYYMADEQNLSDRREVTFTVESDERTVRVRTDCDCKKRIRVIDGFHRNILIEN